MRTWKLVVAYDGARFSGWQRQGVEVPSEGGRLLPERAGERTVQGTLEVALRQLFGGERITVHGAGRTDSGVHAEGQVEVEAGAERPRARREGVQLRVHSHLRVEVVAIGGRIQGVLAELSPL